MTSFGVDANSVFDTSEPDFQNFALEYQIKTTNWMLEKLRKAGVRINVDGTVELTPDMIQIEPDFYSTFDKILDKEGFS